MTPKNSLNTVLYNFYHNYGQAGALSNTPKLFLKALKQRWPKIVASEADIKKFLETQQSYTVHRRISRLNFPRRKINVPASRIRADADLIELGDLSHWNSGYKYVFIVIDAFSRYVWTHPLKSKHADVTAKALSHLIDVEHLTVPLALYTDGGKEFEGAPFQSVLKKHGIKHRVCASDDFHCPFVERCIRTVKESLFQAMTSQYTRRWLDLLPKVVATYNQTEHSSTNQTPAEAHKPENHLAVLRVLHQKQLAAGGKPPKYRYKKGDYVRILKSRGSALKAKGYLPRYSWEIFKIHKLANDRWLDRKAVPAYILKDLNNEVIVNAIFYEAELSRVHPSQLERPAPIREILEKKGNRVLVWWMGHPKSSAQWILEKNLYKGDT